MDSLADSAVRAVSRHPAPALALDEVARLVSRSGHRVSEAILLRTLAAESERLRILELPVCRWGTLPPDLPLPGPAGVWVVPRARSRGWSPGPRRPVLDRLRACLVHLGWSVDHRSPTDLTRWAELVQESLRVRGAA